MLPYRNYVEINLDYLAENLKIVRQLTAPECRIMAVLKGNFYGYGLEQCCPVCEGHADWFAVATFEEAVSLRKAGAKKPILIFGWVPEEHFNEVIENKLTVSVFSYRYALRWQEFLKNSDRKVSIHIKVDTGLNRTGLRVRSDTINSDIDGIKKIYSMPNLMTEGIYTHFSCADSDRDDDIEFTEEQFQCFKTLCEKLKAIGIQTGIKHCCSTDGILLYPHMHMDMVRTGMLCLGQSISEESVRKLKLRPVIRWYARIIQIRNIRAGESVSYGRRFTADKDMKIGLVAVGYADGYKRSLSNKASVLVKGRRTAVLGTVCMDYIMIDLSEFNDIGEDEWVTLLGRDGNDTITVNELTGLTDSVCGEVTCGIADRVKRVYI